MTDVNDVGSEPVVRSVITMSMEVNLPPQTTVVSRAHF